MSGTRELVTLAELEVAASGGSCRLFKVPLEGGGVVFISFQAVNFRGLDPTPAPPSNSELHEAIASIANARCFDR